MSRTPLRKRLAHRRRYYRCKVCREEFSRRSPNCPVCKSRKGSRGGDVGFKGGVQSNEMRGDSGPRPPEPS